MTQPSLSSLTQQLVLSLQPELAAEKPSVLNHKREQVLREIRADSHGGSRKVWEDVEGSVSGLIRTAQIRVQHDLAEGLEKAMKVLEEHRRRGRTGWEGDLSVKMSNLPQHIQLLLNLADRPTSSTHDFAYDYLHREIPSGPTADQILYEEIMSSEPFIGDHWGPGFDDEVKEGWTDSEDSEGESSSEEEILTPHSRKSKGSHGRLHGGGNVDDNNDRLRVQEAQEKLRLLAKNAYWRVGGIAEDMRRGKPNGWMDISTGIAPNSLAVITGQSLETDTKMITAQQFQRELLFCLSGRSGIFTDLRTDGKCLIRPDHPGVRQYTNTALMGILEAIRSRAEQASQLRHFISDTLQPSAMLDMMSSSRNVRKHPTTSLTKQAFAEACRAYLETYDHWIAELEASFTLGISKAESSTSVPGISAATTPLLLRLELDTKYGDGLELLSGFIPHADNPTMLLNMIYSTILSLQSAYSRSNPLETLLSIFISTAAPVWSMLGDWLIQGMPVPASLAASTVEYTSFSTYSDEERFLNPEFFIKRDRDVSWVDEDFWEAGFIDDEAGWPLWLDADGVKEAVMESGKARGLLKSLSGTSEDDPDIWLSLSEVLQNSSTDHSTKEFEKRSSESDGSDSFPQSGVQRILQIPNIAQQIADYICPISQISLFQVRRVLEDECGLQQHLDAIEGVMYMRGFEVMDDWAEWLFVQIQGRRSWADFQLLTSAFRDTVDRSSAFWLNPSAVRVRTTRRVGNATGIEVLSTLRMDYQVPFPLSQLFSSTTIELRGDVFVFLLQIQRARKALISTKLLDAGCMTALTERGDLEDLKAVLRIRHRLAWVIDAVWIWITERVIEIESKRYRTKLESLSSFKAMIHLELEHARRIRDFCFLHEETSTLRESFTSILKIALSLTECYTSYATDLSQQIPSLQAPRASDSTRTRHRQSRQRNHRRNQDIETSDEETENEDLGDEKDTTIRETSVDLVDVGLGERIRRFNKELIGHLSTLRVEVEGLAGEMGDEGDGRRTTWGMLAFALEAEGWKV